MPQCRWAATCGCSMSARVRLPRAWRTSSPSTASRCWQRIAVVAAGPLANLLLAVVAYWFICSQSGESGLAPVIGDRRARAPLWPNWRGLRPARKSSPSTAGTPPPGRRSISPAGPDRRHRSDCDFAVRYPDSDMVYQSEAMLDRLAVGRGTPTCWRPGHHHLLPTPDSTAAGHGGGRGQPRGGGGILLSGAIWYSRPTARPMPGWRWTGWTTCGAPPGRRYTVEVDRDGEGQRDCPEVFPQRTRMNDAGRPSAAGGRGGATRRVAGAHDAGVSAMARSRRLRAATERTGEMVTITLDIHQEDDHRPDFAKNLSGPITIAKVATASAESGLEAPTSAFLAC